MVARSDIDGTVPDDRTGQYAVTRGGAPDLGAGLRIESIDTVIETTRIDHPVNNRRTGLHPTVRRRSPKPVAVHRVECIDPVVKTSDVHDAARNSRRRKDTVTC